MNTTPFAENMLVLTHLPDDTLNGKIIPVAGVVITSGEVITKIRVRDKHGNLADVEVTTDQLEAR